MAIVFMKKAFLLTAFFAWLLSAQNLVAQGNELSSALSQLSEGVKFYTLDNGLRVLMYRRGTAPVFAGVVGVRVGGVDEKIGETGISHMLEHMAFKGTPQVGTTDYRQERELLNQLEKLAQQTNSATDFSAEQKEKWDELNVQLDQLWVKNQFWQLYEVRGATGMNATTGKEITNYMINLPKSAFEFWCWMESERLLRPVMRQFYQERDVVVEEKFLRYENRPEGKLYEMLLGAAYRVHPYRNPVIGYDFDLYKLTASQTEEFRKRYYVPSNMVISVVGDLDTLNDYRTIQKYFGRLPVGPKPSQPAIIDDANGGSREVTLTARSSPVVMIAYHKPSYPHPDDPALSLLFDILAGSSVSPMYQALVKEKRIASGIDFDEGPGFAYPNLVIFSASIQAPYGNADFIAEFDRVLAAFLKTGITEQQLQIAKRRVAMTYLNGLRSNMDLALDLVSSELTYKSGWRSIVDWFDATMAVKAGDVDRVARQYLVPSSRTIARLEQKAEDKK